MTAESECSYPVLLNIYDLPTNINFAYRLGLGIHHSGVEIHGIEYAFAACDHDPNGIFQSNPRQFPGLKFRKTIVIGKTKLGVEQIEALVRKLGREEYKSVLYNKYKHNCNDFSNHICVRLTGREIPSWVNRLARIARSVLCDCLISTRGNDWGRENESLEYCFGSSVVTYGEWERITATTTVDMRSFQSAHGDQLAAFRGGWALYTQEESIQEEILPEDTFFDAQPHFDDEWN